MFKSQQAFESGQVSPQPAVEAAKELYKACLRLGEGDNPSLGLALVSVAIQYQTGEFGDDVAEFERRVKDLLAEANQNKATAPVD